MRMVMAMSVRCEDGNFEKTIPWKVIQIDGRQWGFNGVGTFDGTEVPRRNSYFYSCYLDTRSVPFSSSV